MCAWRALADRAGPEPMTTVVAANLVLDVHAELGEGPIWDPSRERLFFVDINGRRLHVFNPSTGAHRSVEVSRQVSAVACTTRGDLVAAAGSGFVRIDPENGVMIDITHVEDAARRTRMNDGAADARGRFWAGTMSLEGTAGQGTLYRLDPDLTVHAVVTPVTTSNGPAWSPDSRLMYYVDTRTRRIDVFDFDLEAGTLSSRRTFVDFTGGKGRPDGVTVDRDGGVWVGLWEGGEMRRYTPDARLDVVIPLPAARVTKGAFGGPDLKDLYITTARAPGGHPDRDTEPHAGGLFHARPGVGGMPAPAFAG